MAKIETYKKSVLDGEQYALAAMECFRMSLINLVIANTAEITQHENPDFIEEIIDAVISANEIKVTIIKGANAEKKTTTSWTGLCFDAKHDKKSWYKKMSGLLHLLLETECWYEDKIGSGFCWKNPEPTTTTSAFYQIEFKPASNNNSGCYDDYDTHE